MNYLGVSAIMAILINSKAGKRMKTLLLKLMAISAGTVVGLGLVGIVLYVVIQRPKPWDSEAVTAKLRKYSIYENIDKPQEPHYYTNLFFDVTNNTNRDYTLPVAAWSQHLMEDQSGSMLGSSGWDVSLSQGIMPFSVPSGFFDPKPILIPSHATVQILFGNDTAYSPSHVAGKTKQQIAETEFQHIDGLVALDDATHYRINFPMKEFWKSAPER